MDKKYAEYLLEKTRKDYNLIAEDFSRTRWDIWNEFGAFRGYIKDGDKVLDIGCGNGRLLKLLKDKDIEYIGIDNSEKLIEIAQKRYSIEKFLVANALNIPFPEDYFDVVFLIAVLHNIPSREFRSQILEETRRVLKSKGFLILTVWDIWRKEAIKPILKYLFLKLIGKSKLDFRDVFLPWANKTIRYFHFFTKKELSNLIEEKRFKIKETGIAKNETGKRSNIFLIAQK